LRLDEDGEQTLVLDLTFYAGSIYDALVVGKLEIEFT